MNFKVVIKKLDGSQETKAIEALNRFAVYEIVEKDGGTVVSIAEGKKGGANMEINLPFLKKKIKTEVRITFAKNLSAMLGAGLMLSRALSVLERQSPNKKLKDVIVDLESKIKAGTSFHEALETHPDVFSKLFIAMTKAGEEGGKLSESLQIVARQMDKAYTLTKKVKGAMIYPCIILFAIVIIGILMLIFVVPTLSATFASFHEKLPIMTQIIVDISNFMRSNIIVVILGLVVIIVGGSYFLRSKIGQTSVLYVARRVPVIGELVQETFAARAARTLSSLLSSGVEMLTALSITKEVVGDNVYGAIVSQAEERVRKGDPLSAPFIEQNKLYPILFGEMIAVGEETGKVAEMLSQIAEYYENDVEDRTKDLSTIIEPILMLFIGVFVGVFAVAMIAPIYQLSSAIS